ncbi:SDR family oxidoreductase [Alysiella filiformis]|uniref:Short-chain dehydrogenase n=1 Tax=Alysiella filiformis DSM 16848 TaxID=1120981 RepID=A0A286EE12_9NEIS|nr:SDR family oxidoreductase [Alysiella filiformis]QMT30925.1 SDR family oxidoreductase [Alysiella filiformis]UBQ56088.1 SDR family oxidoreductase [Alysiella filiformis DSM 16848]SOD69145.1 Short-chain dehydrogenase [Alysiella filiformis DSM 16848]
MNKPLENKYILITGASQGLGEQVAQAAATAGATVILLSRSQKKLEKVYDEIVASGAPEPYAICFDLMTAEEKEFAQLADTIALATQGKLDGIVHCASYFAALSPLDFQTVEDWVKQYRVNAVAPMALTRAVLPMLKESADASVILVGESHGAQPQAYWGGFGASKAGMNYLCQVIADEWSRFAHLRANVLIPGKINSPQRIKTHPGETATERRNMSDITPDFVWWLSAQSRGRTGEIVYL